MIGVVLFVVYVVGAFITGGLTWLSGFRSKQPFEITDLVLVGLLWPASVLVFLLVQLDRDNNR